MAIEHFLSDKLVDRLEALLAENERLGEELRATERAAELLNHANAILKEQNDHFRGLTKMVPKWVSVGGESPIGSDSLPKEGETVLAFSPEDGINVARYVGFRAFLVRCLDLLRHSSRVTHWMPLPEPPHNEDACPDALYSPGTLKPLTNADRIRAMTDEELVDFLWQFNDDSFENVMPFCKNTVECGEKLDSNDISTEMCKRCLLDKLRQPYESPTGQKG